MVYEAQREHDIDLARSFFIGDKAIDIECGRNAGVRTILVKTGYGANETSAAPDWIAADLSTAVGIIPARWSSTRFPGKPLHLIAGKPLLQHVWERCQHATSLDSIIIATDDM